MKNLYTFFLFCFFIFSIKISQAQISERKIKETHLVKQETKTGTLHGTLLLPASKTAVPLVLIQAGSGPTNRDGNNPVAKNNSLLLLATALQNEGIATLRIDKRGVAESANARVPETEMSFDFFVNDLVNWAKMFENDPRFSRIVLAGHSQGSLVAMLAAPKCSASGYISIAGAGENIGHTLIRQMKDQPTEIEKEAVPIFEKLMKGESVPNPPAALQGFIRPSVQPFLISWMKYDPTEAIKKINFPVLILQGSTDVQVLESDAKNLADAHPNAQLEIIDGMNHVLRKAPEDYDQNIATYSEPALPLSPELTPILVDYINK